ncbi:GNAT family N-acetyltransferase [Kitasatospora phosalacinea]|uniref:GNAT family N-acetyltransferase n=1 Tax=Kitasatospora phosalacinea TaxID=2065 RepID=UPI003657D34A
MVDYTVRLATPDDLPALMALRSEAERWLADAGIDQWSDPDLGERAIRSWRERIDGGQTWVFTTPDDTIAGTISRGRADNDFWREDDAPSSALYLYKLIVARAHSGEQLGARILDWYSTIAAAEGKLWIRLDVWRNNRKLQEYYTKLGFEHVRTERVSNRLSGWLGQRPAGSLTLPDRLLPVIPSALPRQYAADVAAAQQAAETLSQQVASLFLTLQQTSVPVTGPVRWECDQAMEDLYLAGGAIRRALEHLTQVSNSAKSLPDPTDLRWAAAPRCSPESSTAADTSSTR